MIRPKLCAWLPFTLMGAALFAVVLAGSTLTGSTSALAEEGLNNIKVLPKDISKRELGDVMHGWSDALGVHCTHCHVMKVPGDFNSMDFQADDKGAKKAARRMYTMVQELNTNLVPKAAGQDDAAVSCVTCHRGLANPATLDQVVLHEVQKSGAEAGVQKYGELREKYYGMGSYNFGPDSLDPAIRDLAAKPNSLDAAKALVDLEIKEYPDNADNRLKLAQILMMKSDKAGAMAALDEALKLDPQNRSALRMKQQMGN